MLCAEISLEVKDILKGHGIDPQRAHPSLLISAEQALHELTELLDPRATYDLLDVRDFHHKTIELEEGVTFEGPLAARALADAEKVAGVCADGVRVLYLSSSDEERVLAYRWRNG